jgi:hypothetical protein
MTNLGPELVKFAAKAGTYEGRILGLARILESAARCLDRDDILSARAYLQLAREECNIEIKP